MRGLATIQTHKRYSYVGQGGCEFYQFPGARRELSCPRKLLQTVGSDRAKRTGQDAYTLCPESTTHYSYYSNTSTTTVLLYLLCCDGEREGGYFQHGGMRGNAGAWRINNHFHWVEQSSTTSWRSALHRQLSVSVITPCESSPYRLFLRAYRTAACCCCVPESRYPFVHKHKKCYICILIL